MWTTWGAISIQLGWAKTMLSNYDARAVAAVLGLAFLRLPEDVTRPESRPEPGGRRSRQDRRSSDLDVVVQVGDTAVIVAGPKLEADRHPSPASTDTGVASDLQSRLPSSPSLLIERAVESGLPRASLRHVAESIAGGDRTKVSALEWGVVPKTTLERRDIRLSVPESERTERIARLFVHARRALGTEAEARDFMTTPHPELDGRSPMMIAKTDLGTRRTERLLTALEYGLAL